MPLEHITLPPHRIVGAWSPREGVVVLTMQMDTDDARRLTTRLRSTLGIEPDEAEEFAEAEKTGASTAPRPIIDPQHVSMSREIAEAQGFTGDACDGCGSFRVQRTGTCATCTDCGRSQGCG